MEWKGNDVERGLSRGSSRILSQMLSFTPTFLTFPTLPYHPSVSSQARTVRLVIIPWVSILKIGDACPKHVEMTSYDWFSPRMHIVGLYTVLIIRHLEGWLNIALLCT